MNRRRRRGAHSHFVIFKTLRTHRIDAMSTEKSAAVSGGAPALFSCSGACECENKAENWSTCVGCSAQMCDFADPEHGWHYDDATETWLCGDCGSKCAVCGDKTAEGDGVADSNDLGKRCADCKKNICVGCWKSYNGKCADC